MKNRLLALMALCTATASTMPLWAVEDPELEFVTDMESQLAALKAEPGTTGVYYIYHVATGKFMTAGAQYGTQCAVENEGEAVTVSYGQDYQLVSVTGNEHSDAMGYRLTMWNAPSNGGFHELFLHPEKKIYVDHNMQGHILWDILPQGDGVTYRIQVNADDPLYGKNKDAANTNAYMGVDPDDTQGVVSPLVDLSSAGFEDYGLDWKFVTPEVYELFVAKRDLLKPQLDQAEAEGVECASETALYNNPEATVEEIEKAAEELKNRVFDKIYAEASTDNPVNVSNLMSNPTFSGNANGWTSEREPAANGQQDNWQYQGSVQTTSDGMEFTGFWERWNPNAPQTDWSIHQEINNIPNGRYRLTAYALTNVQKTEEVSGPQGLYVYAVSFGSESRSTEQPLPSPDGKGYASPISVEFDVVDHRATVGFKAVGYNSNWSGVDNFKLEYMGSTGAKTLREIFSAALEESSDYVNNEVGPCSTAALERFEEFLKTAEEAVENMEVTDDSLSALADMLGEERTILDNDVNAYATVSSYVETQTAERLNGGAYAGKLNESEFAQYLSTLSDEVYESIYDASQVDSLEIKGDSLYLLSVANLLSTDPEVTNADGLFTNLDFSNGTSGWSGDGATANRDGAVEMFNKNFNFYQEVSGLPAGTYEVTLQGFYRPAGNDACQAAWKVEGDPNYEVLAYAYVNEGMAKLKHCYDHVTDTVVNGDDITLAVTDEAINGKVAVNNLTSASKVLAHGDYPVTVKGYVGSDGVLRIGVKVDDTNRQGNSWCAFGHFSVKYCGAADMSGAVSTLEALINRAQEVLAQTNVTTEEAKTGLNEAITAANTALSSLTLESYQANTEALNKAIEKAQEDVTAVAALETKVVNHDEKIMGSGEESYEQYADYEGYEELADLVEKLLMEHFSEEPTNFASLTEVEQYSLELDKAYSKMVSGGVDVETASLNAPVDVTAFIINPSFSVMATVTDESGVASQVEQASADSWVATAGKATTGFNYEMYGGDNEGNKIADDASIRQTLYNLPAGYYRLIWDGFYRECDHATAALARRDGKEEINAEAFVSCGKNNWSEKMQSIYVGVREGKYDSGDVVLADSLFPDRPNEQYHVVVNNVAGAKLAFEDGVYESSLSFHVAEGEEPTIGVRKTKTVLKDWTCVDNFRLEYYGDGDANKPEDFVSSVEDAVAEGTAEVVATQWFTINGVRVDEPKQRGIYIRQDILADGSKKAVKVMVK